MADSKPNLSLDTSLGDSKDRPISILHIDEDPAVRDVVSLLLRPYNFFCHGVPGAKEALEIIPKVRPDLVITDYHTASLSGEQFIQEVKNIDANLPTLLLTSEGKKDMLFDLVGLPRFLALEKFPNAETLLDAIQELLGMPPQTLQSCRRTAFRAPVAGLELDLGKGKIGKVDNISMTGMKIQIVDKIPDSVSKNVEVALKTEDGAFRMNTEKVWQKEQGAGLQFTELSPEAYKFVRNLISNYISQNKVGWYKNKKS